MQQFMGAIERKCSIVNLDPANDHTSYQPAVDVRDLVTIDEIMEQENLGPNGGVLFALEELENNFDWLAENLKELGGLQQSSTAKKIGINTIVDEYILFDCPGQVELFTHHGSLRNIFFRLQKLGYRVFAHRPLPATAS
jgi:GTPase SAR1 family protein